MTNITCEQLFEQNPGWSLVKKNACHIGVMNSEMGDLRDEFIAMADESQKQSDAIRSEVRILSDDFSDVKENQIVISTKLSYITIFMGVIMATVAGFVLKEILKNTFNIKK